MKFRTASYLAIGLMFGMPAERVTDAVQEPSVQWLTDRKSAFDQARQTGKPLWVLFR